VGKEITMQGRVFIAATKQNDGKTTISLGLINVFRKKLKKVGFIKPADCRT
jgi:BioD-like phosphotransacetylase family protein